MNIESDERQMQAISQSHIDIDSVAKYRENKYIIKLDFTFGLDKMRTALDAITAESGIGDIGSGFSVLPVNC